MTQYTFRETTRFTRRVLEYLSDESYAGMQWYLIRRPDSGGVIPGGGGIRKIRWAAGGQGKRGGVRVIYYRVAARGEIFMLDLYAKSERI